MRTSKLKDIALFILHNKGSESVGEAIDATDVEESKLVIKLVT
jgi:hypothetical protein